MSNSGVVPGFTYAILPGGSDELAMCVFCGTVDLPLLRGTKYHEAPGICEPCSRFIDWIWRRWSGEVPPGIKAATEPSAALVLIVRDRPNDFTVPHDVLMVGRKDEPGAWGLPGGKVDAGEDPIAAAVRELSEETGLETWPRMLLPLYTGLTMRGRLARVYLARGYVGDVEQNEVGVPVEWKPWPPMQHTGVQGGYYVGLVEAFDALITHRSKQGMENSPLCLHCSEHVGEYMARGLDKTAAGSGVPMRQALRMVMTEDERGLVNLIEGMERAEQAQRTVVPVKSRPVAAKDEPEPESAEQEPEAENLEEPAEVEESLGIVRPPPPSLKKDDR